MAIFGGKQLRAPTARRGSLRRPASGTSLRALEHGCSFLHPRRRHFSFTRRTRHRPIGRRFARVVRWMLHDDDSRETLAWRLSSIARETLPRSRLSRSMSHSMLRRKSLVPSHLRLSSRSSVRQGHGDAERRSVYRSTLYAGRIIARVYASAMARARARAGQVRDDVRWTAYVERRTPPRDGYRRPGARAANNARGESHLERQTLSKVASSPVVARRAIEAARRGETAHFALPWAATRFRPIPRQLILAIQLANPAIPSGSVSSRIARWHAKIRARKRPTVPGRGKYTTPRRGTTCASRRFTLEEWRGRAGNICQLAKAPPIEYASLLVPPPPPPPHSPSRAVAVASVSAVHVAICTATVGSHTVTFPPLRRNAPYRAARPAPRHLVSPTDARPMRRAAFTRRRTSPRERTTDTTGRHDASCTVCVFQRVDVDSNYTSMIASPSHC